MYTAGVMSTSENEAAISVSYLCKSGYAPALIFKCDVCHTVRPTRPECGSHNSGKSTKVVVIRFLVGVIGNSLITRVNGSTLTQQSDLRHGERLMARGIVMSVPS